LTLPDAAYYTEKRHTKSIKTKEKAIDTITHTITGVVVSKSGLNKTLGKWGTIAGITAALFPDADFFLRYIDVEFYLRHHRGITTSVFMVLPFCLLSAHIFNRFSGKKRFLEFFLISLAAFLSHIFLDAITSFGTMLLAPFSQHRFALDLVFIIDIILTGILLSALILSYTFKRKAIGICRLGLAMSLIYVAFCGVNHYRAYQLAEQFAKSRGLAYTKLASLPQPASPFRWANLIQTDGIVYQGLVNLAKKDNPGKTPHTKSFWYYLGSRYKSPSQLEYRAWKRFSASPWVDRALATDGAKFFYWFARFPIVKGVYEEEDRHRVEFFDLRFHIMDGNTPFRYVIEFDKGGKLLHQGFAMR
jgi:inner membrane protein